MSVKLMVLKAKIRLLAQRVRKEALKLSLAVVIVEFVIVSVWYQAEKHNLLEWIKPKTIIIEMTQKAEAKEIAPVKNRIDELMDTIYNLESSNGKNNYSKCEAIGKFNGIGYGIDGSGKYICFNSHNEEMEVLRGWIVAKQASGMSEIQMLCSYSGNNYQGCKTK